MAAQAGEAPDTGALADSPAAGGALYAALTACSAVRAAGLAGGEGRGRRVLLLGLGGVGHAALQLLARRGFDVLVGCAGELAERARTAGAAYVLDRHAPDYGEQLAASGPCVSRRLAPRAAVVAGRAHPRFCAGTRRSSTARASAAGRRARAGGAGASAAT